MKEDNNKINPAFILFIIVFVMAVYWFISGLMDLKNKVGKPIQVSQNINIVRNS